MPVVGTDGHAVGGFVAGGAVSSALLLRRSGTREAARGLEGGGLDGSVGER